jgi:predicted Zn-dependent protease
VHSRFFGLPCFSNSGVVELVIAALCKKTQMTAMAISFAVSVSLPIPAFADRPLEVSLNVDVKKNEQALLRTIRENAKLTFETDTSSQAALWFYLLQDRFINGRQHTLVLVRKSLKEHPKLAILHYYLAKEAQVELDDERAIVELGEAIKCKPDFITALSERANLLRQSGDHAGCLRDIQKAEAQTPYKLRFKAITCKAYFHLKEYEKAYQEARAFLKLSPNSMSIWDVAIESSMKLKDWKRALAVCKESEKHGSSATRDAVLGQIYWELKRTSDALRSLDKYVVQECCKSRTVKHPVELSNALRLRATIYTKLGKPQLAAADLKLIEAEGYDQALFMQRQ